MRRLSFVLVLVFVAMAPRTSAQLSPSATWATHAANNYQIAPNVTYLTASNFEAKMDIYYRSGATAPQPTVVRAVRSTTPGTNVERRL